MKTAIVTDSTAYLPPYILEKLDIHTIPLTVTIDGQAYDEEVDLHQRNFTIKCEAKDRCRKRLSRQLGDSLNCSNR